MSASVYRCPTCERHVQLQAVKEYDYSQRGEYDRVNILFAVCPHCAQPFVERKVGQTESLGVLWGGPVLLYPKSEHVLDPAIPANIAASYIGARSCFDDAAQYTAAAIMCRRTLEGICSNLKAEGTNLKGKLDYLKKQGVIEARLHEWADYALRALGNDAAHDVDAVISKEDARDALEFTRAILEYLYIFQKAFDRFKERRKKARPPLPEGEVS